MSIKSFFHASLQEQDPEIFKAIQAEKQRQQEHVELIASENIVSKAVLEAQGSILTNKYAEGYAGRRYYGGCQFVDVAENLAIEWAKKLFQCQRTISLGRPSKPGRFFDLINPRDKFMGMSLSAGGHLTHGSPVTISGKWFQPVAYGVTPEGWIDYDEVEHITLAEKPKLILAGGSAYPRFREIVDKVGAYLKVDKNKSKISPLKAILYVYKEQSKSFPCIYFVRLFYIIYSLLLTGLSLLPFFLRLNTLFSFL